MHFAKQRGQSVTIVARFLVLIGLVGGAVTCGLAAAQQAPQPPATKVDELKPIDEPAWKADFRQAYGLSSGEVLKRVAAPFPACRKEYCRYLRAQYFSDLDDDDVAMSFRWDGKTAEFWGLCKGFASNPDRPIGWALINVLSDLDIPRQEIEGDEELLRQHIEGEFVMRAGAPAEKGIARLEQILRQELKRPVLLTLKQVEREVTIAGGRYESRPRTNRKVNQVDLFAIEPNDNPGAGGGIGTFTEFLVATGSYIGRRLVNDLRETPIGRINWYYHNSTRVLPGPDPNQDPEGVLRNIETQTGLTFKIERRNVRVLFVAKG